MTVAFKLSCEKCCKHFSCIWPIMHHWRTSRTPRMYDSMRLEYYWTHTPNNNYSTVDNCRQCAKQGAMIKHERHLMLFPATLVLDFAAVDILASLSRTRNGSQYVALITDCYTNLTWEIRTSRKSASYVAIILFNNRMILYCICSFLLTENGPKFVAKPFKVLCLDFNVNHLRTTPYRPQRSGQVERYI